MKFHFVCPSGLEPWDHSRPEGIAGSETCVIELSRRLSRRGHDVRVYAPIFDDTAPEDPHSGVRWASIHSRIDAAEEGAWWLCRHPPLIDNFSGTRPDQPVFLRCDDLHYGGSGRETALTPERYRKLTAVLTMSAPHRDVFRAVYPFVEEARCPTEGCGIDSDAIQYFAVHDRSRPTRDPYRLIWVSSPDRGLDDAIRIFHAARAKEPRLNLHVYYGWEGCERASGGNPDDPRMVLKRLCTEELDQTGITWHGRVGKRDLWHGHFASNLWLYPTTFPEAGVVSAQEAQACGAIPVTAPCFGLAEKVQNGVLIPGNPKDPVVFNRYVDAVLRLVGDERTCREIRGPMMDWARERYHWDRVVDLHEELAGCGRPRFLRRGYGDAGTRSEPF